MSVGVVSTRASGATYTVVSLVCAYAARVRNSDAYAYPTTVSAWTNTIHG